MSLKAMLAFGAVLLVGGVTFLQVFVNWGGDVWGERQLAGQGRFRVGFLPVT